MAHVREKSSLGPIGLLGSVQSVPERLLLRQRFSHIFINIGEAHANSVNDMIIPVLRMTNTRHSQHGIGFLPIVQFKKAVRNDLLCCKRGADVFRLNESKIVFSVRLRHMIVGKSSEIPQEGEFCPDPHSKRFCSRMPSR